jgi:glycine amidinotransferase
MAKVKPEHELLLHEGPRSPESIAKCSEELNGLVSVLENRFSVKVYRPELVDWRTPTATPDFEVPCGNTGTMPRDVLLTVGNEIIEATMSW